MFPDRRVPTLRVPALSPTPVDSRVTASAAAFVLGLGLLLLAFPENTRAQAESGGGTILGTVRITEKLTAQRMRFRLYPGARSAGAPPDHDRRDDEHRNIVVYLRSAAPLPSSASAPDRVFSMAQEGETFIPHVLPIPVGSTVEFPNRDPIFHNVFSLSGTRVFDLGRYPQGDSKSVKFDRTGIVPVFCHIHSDMSAIIMVLDNPYFAVPGADHGYRIDGIPPGTYTLVAWHERAAPVERQVEVKAGETLELNLTVPIEDEEPSRP